MGMVSPFGMVKVLLSLFSLMDFNQFLCVVVCLLAPEYELVYYISSLVMLVLLSSPVTMVVLEALGNKFLPI